MDTRVRCYRPEQYTPYGSKHIFYIFQYLLVMHQTFTNGLQDVGDTNGLQQVLPNLYVYMIYCIYYQNDVPKYLSGQKSTNL